MSFPRLLLLALVLAGALGVGGMAIAKQQSDASPASVHSVVPLPANPRLTAKPAAMPPAAQLSGGAGSVSETYGDWAVNCRLVVGQKQCMVLHIRGNSQTGQRVFGIELWAPADGKTRGTILMPFGLRLESGAILKLDDGERGQALRFSTCAPQGCLLPFPTEAIDAMKKARVLTVASFNLDGGQIVAFNVSLEGFAAAIARAAELDGK